MKKLKTTIEVEVSNIQVDEEYYSFDYEIKVDGKSRGKKEYNDDYENGDTPKEWKKVLEEGYAVEQALDEFSFEDED